MGTKPLTYTYERKSTNYFEWLLRLNSVHYHSAESVIVNEDKIEL